MREIHSNMRVAALTPEMKARTCGYWYTVTDGHRLPHTAFRTHAALDAWLNALGLALDGKLPDEYGEPACVKITGSYVREMSLCDSAEWALVPGDPLPVLSNGRYTTGKLATVDGVRVLSVPNPNCAWRDELDYRKCDTMRDRGEMVL